MTTRESGDAVLGRTKSCGGLSISSGRVYRDSFLVRAGGGFEAEVEAAPPFALVLAIVSDRKDV